MSLSTLPFAWRSRAVALTSLALMAWLAISAAPLHAQAKKDAKGSPRGSEKAEPSLVGTWTGKATVQINDSTLVVPVVYTFTQDGTTVGGTAMVPGQGAGPISGVVRTGSRLTFRVGAPEAKVLEHEGAFTADGAIEGTVTLDKLPVAKFRITPKK